MSKRHRYQLTIATEPNATADESHRALRACLKMMLRSYGIKCLSAVAITAADDERGIVDNVHDTNGDAGNGAA